jgi:hypothetical protein
MKLTAGNKMFITFVCFAIAIIGFMVKLPSAFRHMDKELHATFYFLAAALLNILFAKANLIKHAAIFIFLLLFGIAIEYAQETSNRFFRKRIHGRFDPEDLQSNLYGLMAFSIVWCLYVTFVFIYKKATLKEKGYDSKVS